MNWHNITDLGDAAVMLPAGFAIAVWLIVSRAWHDALVWLALFGAGVLVVVGTKIAYVGWGIGVPQLDFTCVSGHAMAATSVLTVAGYFVCSSFSRKGALLAAVLGLGFGLLVGISRIVISAHSTSEAVAGCALGGLIALLAIRAIRVRPTIVAAPLAFAFAFLTLVAAVHGEQAPSEQLITKVALYLSGHSEVNKGD
jgi:membrane-associated phospholipid phosphatase